MTLIRRLNPFLTDSPKRRTDPHSAPRTVRQGRTPFWSVFPVAANSRNNRSHADADRRAFSQIMALATDIASENPQGLRSLLKAILRPLQAEQIAGVVERQNHCAPGQLRSVDFFFEVCGFERDATPGSADHLLNLATDLVFATPWNRVGTAHTMAWIGTAIAGRAWSQDDNHQIDLLLPWGIGIVTCGNHSITAGILAGEGTMTADVVYDMAPILEAVECDGVVYRNRATGTVIAPVTDPRRGAAWEIGRLMRATGTTWRRFGRAAEMPPG